MRKRAEGQWELFFFFTDSESTKDCDKLFVFESQTKQRQNLHSDGLPCCLTIGKGRSCWFLK